MSAFLIVSFSKEVISCNDLLEEIYNQSKKMQFGIFTNNRFIEPFEHEHKACFSFSISDSYDFDNCELLVKPWWYINSSKIQFINNMNKLKSVIDICLKYSDSVDMWIGTSGDTLLDFDNYEIVVDEFISDIDNRYEQNSSLPPPPSIHYHIVKPPQNYWDGNIPIF